MLVAAATILFGFVVACYNSSINLWAAHRNSVLVYGTAGRCDALLLVHQFVLVPLPYTIFK
jgi:hypothetical protein